jgi:hypothetical protein
MSVVTDFPVAPVTPIRSPAALALIFCLLLPRAVGDVQKNAAEPGGGTGERPNFRYTPPARGAP